MQIIFVRHGKQPMNNKPYETIQTLSKRVKIVSCPINIIIK